MHNTDRIYNPDEIKLDKIVEFSEGNVYLYDLLKYCYDIGIKTFACCKGHEASEESNWLVKLPYISFVVDGSNDDMLMYVLSFLMQEGNFGNRISYNLEYLEKKGTTLSIYNHSIDSESIKRFFTFILSIIKAYLQNKVDHIDNKYKNLISFYDMIKTDNIIISGNNKFLSINVKEWKKAFFDKTPNGSKAGLYSYLGYKEEIGINNIGELSDEDYESILEFNNSLSIPNSDIEKFIENVIRIRNGKIR